MNREKAREHFKEAYAKPLTLSGSLPMRDLAAIASVLTEHVDAGRMLERMLADAERKLDQAITDRDKAIEAAIDKPRTITLSYMPRQTLPDGDERCLDYGNHWTVSEAGKHLSELDPRETLALVAAMLLGAPHPPLQSMHDYADAARRRERKRADADPRPILPI